MIPFEIEKLRVEHVWVKSLTQALGGSIRIVDEEQSTEDNEVYKKVNVPMAVVRQFVKANGKVSRYLRPVLSAITYYGDNAVALERHPTGGQGRHIFEGLDGEERVWQSYAEQNLDRYVMPITSNGDWYIDGTFIYTFTKKDLQDATMLSSDNKFRSVAVRAFKLADIDNSSKMGSPQDRSCLMYRTGCGKVAMSPPIWKQLDGMGGSQLGMMSEDEETGESSSDEIGLIAGNRQFDRINEMLAVNLSFALKAGEKLADTFGYDAIEPLGLDEMMVQLRTVNLPRVAKEVKQTFDIGIPFTHAVAWLLGLTARTETLESYITLRSLLKYLTTKGIYRRNAFTPDAVYKKGQDLDSVPLMTVEEAHKSMRDRFNDLRGTFVEQVKDFFEGDSE